MTDPSLETTRRLGEHLVREAGARLRDYFGQVTAKAKGPFDVVTEADTAIEAFLAGELARHFPTDGFLGEEGVGAGQRPTLRARQWVLDPLDGTVNFANGHPFFAVSLALLVDGSPQLAWVYDPVHDELFAAGAGQGATCNGRPLKATGPDAAARSAMPFGLSSGLLASPAPEHQALCRRIFEQCGRVRILGSQALHLCYVAAGRLQGAASLEAKLWDDAAGALIVSESGQGYSKLNGERGFPLQDDDPALLGGATGSLAAAHDRLAELHAVLRGASDSIPQTPVRKSP